MKNESSISKIIKLVIITILVLIGIILMTSLKG